MKRTKQGEKEADKKEGKIFDRNLKCAVEPRRSKGVEREKRRTRARVESWKEGKFCIA